VRAVGKQWADFELLVVAVQGVFVWPESVASVALLMPVGLGVETVV